MIPIALLLKSVRFHETKSILSKLQFEFTFMYMHMLLMWHVFRNLLTNSYIYPRFCVLYRSIVHVCTQNTWKSKHLSRFISSNLCPPVNFYVLDILSKKKQEGKREINEDLLPWQSANYFNQHDRFLRKKLTISHIK